MLIVCIVLVCLEEFEMPKVLKYVVIVLVKLGARCVEKFLC